MGAVLDVSAITIVAVSATYTVPSVTFSVNRTGVSADTGGAVNVTFRAAVSSKAMPSEVLLNVQVYARRSSGSSSEVVPFRDTVSPSVTFRLAPASTEGGLLATSFTVMVTVSVSVREPESVTVRVIMISRVSPTLGASNDGVAVVAPVSDMAGPLVCSHRYDREVPSSVSRELAPLSDTVAPSVTVWLAPASAVGGLLKPAAAIL